MTSKLIISCPKCSTKIGLPNDKHLKFTCPKCGEKFEYNGLLKVKQKQSTDAGNIKKPSIKNKIINVISWLIIIPTFIFLFKYLHEQLPNFDLAIDIDQRLVRILAIIFMNVIISLIVWYILHLFRELVLIIAVIFFIGLSYGSVRGHYGFGDMIDDYQTMIFTMIFSSVDKPIPQPLEYSKNISYLNASPEIKGVIDFENPEIRNFANLSTKKHFEYFSDKKHPQSQSDRSIIQYLSIFKEINSKWYPVDFDSGSVNYAKATDTLQHRSGNKNDCSIFLASCIKSIGGNVRLLKIGESLSVELCIGTKEDVERINFLIKTQLFPFEIKDKKLNWHIDDLKNVWLNMDLGEYPGENYKRTAGDLIIITID